MSRNRALEFLHKIAEMRSLNLRVRKPNPSPRPHGVFAAHGASGLVLADYGAGELVVSMNNGDGSFAPKVPWPLATSPYSVKLGDLNGDGHLDVAVASSDSWGPEQATVFLSECR